MAIRQPKNRAVTEFGDFQTPLTLAEGVTSLLVKSGLKPHSVIEPTCGRGAFVIAASTAFPQARILGFEINPDHLMAAEEATRSFGTRVRLAQGDFFATDWDSIIQPNGSPWLIVGNPPWVTSAELGAIASTNLPEKSNFQGRKGFEAITGKANFDISEWMMLAYLRWLEGQVGTIAVLCKISVARKILTHVWKTGKPVSDATIYKIDAAAEFGAAVDACLFVLAVGTHSSRQKCKVFDGLEASQPSQILGFDDGHLVGNIEAFEKQKDLIGPDPNYVWRSGVKHDCSKVMELRRVEGGYENGLGVSVSVEPDLLYPMLKSSDVGNGRLKSRGVMIVPQQGVGQDTSHIEADYPATWSYLSEHADLLGKRGSSIYKKNPAFSIFGVGRYTFAPWKVAISGFYKRLNFVVVGPENGKPVVFDDTVYFLSCASESEARFLESLLHSHEAQQLLGSIIHWDEKRPITVSVLKRLNIQILAEKLGKIDEYNSYCASSSFALAA